MPQRPTPDASGARGAALALCVLVLTGCASLDVPERHDRVRLSETGLSAINGLYAYKGHRTQCPPEAADTACQIGFGLVLSADAPVLFTFSTGPDLSWADSLTTFRLEALATDLVRVTVLGADGKTWTEDFHATVRPDGYARLDVHSGLVGFPPLVWGFRSARAQIGLAASGDLVYDQASGGMAFFTLIPIFFDGTPLGPVSFRRLGDPPEATPR